MKVTVCEIENAAGNLEQDWLDLVRHVNEHESELVVLPEMVFAEWLSATDQVDQARWDAAVVQHAHWIGRFEALARATVVGAVPTVRGGRNHNEAFVWTVDDGLRHVHTKYYLPNEPEFWEAEWYERADTPTFKAFEAKGVTMGAMLCTDLWFSEHARGYGRQGVQIVVNPRTSVNPKKWLAGGRAAAIMAGAFCLSSNHVGDYGDHSMEGGGWIVDPNGEVLGVTSAEKPFLTLDIDLAQADAAKTTYPRYVLE